MSKTTALIVSEVLGELRGQAAVGALLDSMPHDEREKIRSGIAEVIGDALSERDARAKALRKIVQAFASYELESGLTANGVLFDLDIGSGNEELVAALKAPQPAQPAHDEPSTLAEKVAAAVLADLRGRAGMLDQTDESAREEFKSELVAMLSVLLPPATKSPTTNPIDRRIAPAAGEQHSASVLEVIQLVQGSGPTGTFHEGAYTDEELESIVSWLRWRLGEGWKTSGLKAGRPFDEAVRRLGIEALRAYNSRVNEPYLRDEQSLEDKLSLFLSADRAFDFVGDGGNIAMFLRSFGRPFREGSEWFIRADSGSSWPLSGVRNVGGR